MLLINHILYTSKLILNLFSHIFLILLFLYNMFIYKTRGYLFCANFVCYSGATSFPWPTTGLATFTIPPLR